MAFIYDFEDDSVNPIPNPHVVDPNRTVLETAFTADTVNDNEITFANEQDLAAAAGQSGLLFDEDPITVSGGLSRVLSSLTRYGIKKILGASISGTGGGTVTGLTNTTVSPRYGNTSFSITGISNNDTYEDVSHTITVSALTSANADTQITLTGTLVRKANKKCEVTVNCANATGSTVTFSTLTGTCLSNNNKLKASINFVFLDSGFTTVYSQKFPLEVNDVASGSTYNFKNQAYDYRGTGGIITTGGSQHFVMEIEPSIYNTINQGRGEIEITLMNALGTAECVSITKTHLLPWFRPGITGTTVSMRFANLMDGGGPTGRTISITMREGDIQLYFGGFACSTGTKTLNASINYYVYDSGNTIISQGGFGMHVNDVCGYGGSFTYGAGTYKYNACGTDVMETGTSRIFRIVDVPVTPKKVRISMTGRLEKGGSSTTTTCTQWDAGSNYVDINLTTASSYTVSLPTIVAEGRPPTA